MTDRSERTQKKLIFKGVFLRWPGEEAQPRPASSLGWEFARAALRGEPVHLLDGFMIHRTWRTREQEGPYLNLFRTNKRRAVCLLRALGMENVSIDRPAKEDLYTWQLAPLDGFGCNITEAVQMTREARKKFCRGDAAGGWCLLQAAYEQWPDARSVYQALAVASNLPEGLDEYEDWLARIKVRLTKYRDDLMQALYKVLSLAAENRQGITLPIGELAITQWVNEFFTLKQALTMIGDHRPAASTSVASKITEFVQLLRDYTDAKGGLLALKENGDTEGRVSCGENEVAEVLDRLKACPAMVDITEKTSQYYEGLLYLNIGWDQVTECLVNAIEGFSEQGHTFSGDDGLVHALFEKYLRTFVGQFWRGQGIREVLRSARNAEEKKKDFQCILEDMVDEEECRIRLRKLFGVNQQPSSDQHGAVLPIAGTVCPLGGPDSLQSGGLEVVGLDHGYLKSIDHVLRKGSGEDAELFRKGGPIAVDFDAGMVCPRPEASNELQKLVLENEFSLLEGERAAGKTVLARGLGYHLAEAEGMVVYWFDCDSEMNLDIKQLIKEMRGLRGVFIIENIHLYTKEFQRLYYSLGRDSLRHVLFTARPSFRELESERQWRLSSLGRLSMESYDDIDDLMEFFARRHPEMEWAEDVHSAFREGCGGDLWCLSYSLTGYCDTRGAGCVRNWAAAGVKSELRELEKLNRVWPEVLVAISALYREGNWTAESFLIDRLGFQIDILQELTVRGDIRRVTEQGHFFYGGTHSTLADLYWEYGKEYRRRRGLPEYEEYLYEYAAAGTPNGLLAVMQTRATTRQSVVGRLYTDGKLPSAITSEEGMAGAFLWRVFDGAYVQDAQVMQAIGDKISVTNDLTNAGHCLTGPRGVTGKIDPIVWKYVDRRRLAQNVSRAKDFRGLESFLIGLPDKKAGKEICNLLDLQCLAAGIMAAENPDRACGVIRRLFQFSTEVGHKLWSLVDHKQLATVLQYRDPDELCYAVGSLFFGCDDAGGELWRLIDKEMLKSKLNALQGIVQLTECIKGMFGVFDVVDIRPMGMVDALRFWMCDSKWMNACDQFYEMIDLAAVAHNLKSCQDARDAVICLANICGTDKKRGVELMCDVVGCDKVLDMLLRASLDLYLYDYIRIIIDAEEVCLDEQAYLRAAFCSHLDIESLAAKLSSGIHFLSYYGTGYLSVVNELDPDCAHRLCEKLQIEALAKCLRREKDSARVTRCVNVIKSVNSDVGTALSALLRRP